MTGLMRPNTKPEGELLQSLRSAFGPTTGTARTLEERLQSLTEQQLQTVMRTAQMVKMASSTFKRSRTETYQQLVDTMYPRLSWDLRNLIAEVLQDADPIFVDHDTTNDPRDAAIKSVLSEYDVLFDAGPDTSPVERREPQQLAFDFDAASSPITNSNTREAFVDSIAPTAKAVAEELGIDPRIVIAQAALETGWGKKVKGNNLFGIKSHGKQDGLMVQTHEVVDGKHIQMRDSFRQYNSFDDSIIDYGNFLQQNKRYKPMLQATTLQEQVEALGKSGYATDPEYADKVMAIATSKRLEGL